MATKRFVCAKCGRTRQQKESEVLKLLRNPKWRMRSVQWIASQAHVSDAFVSTVMRAEERRHGRTKRQDVDLMRVGRDGKRYPARRTG